MTPQAKISTLFLSFVDIFVEIFAFAGFIDSLPFPTMGNGCFMQGILKGQCPLSRGLGDSVPQKGVQGTEAPGKAPSRLA
jgi:hypothetical protein